VDDRRGGRLCRPRGRRRPRAARERTGQLAVGYHVRHWLQPELELNYQASFGADAHAVAVTVGVVVPWGGGHRIVAAVQQGVFGWNTPPTTGGVLAYKRAL
jgi:hypothetical protein